MQAATRTAVRSARLWRPRGQRQTCRHESHSSGGSQEHHSSHSGHESFGAGFYIVIAAVPASVAVYKFSRSGDQQPYFTRYITETYDDLATKWARRNDFHTRAVEQAAADRVLFLNEATQNVRTVDLRFPEQFNQGSPWNVAAGHGSANIGSVIAKYEKETFEENEKRLKQLRENKILAEQPKDPLANLPPATPSS